MSFNFTSFPKLNSVRLVLTKADFKNKNNIKSIFDLRSSKEINKFVGTKRVKDLNEAKDFINDCDLLFNKKKRIFWWIYF